MARKKQDDASGDMLAGTLDMMILKTLVAAPAHGHTIAHAIEKSSEEVLQVEHGSLYPALYRLENRGWIRAKWIRSELGRPVKSYQLTAAGRRQLAANVKAWSRFSRSVSKVLLNP